MIAFVSMIYYSGFIQINSFRFTSYFLEADIIRLVLLRGVPGPLETGNDLKQDNEGTSCLNDRLVEVECDPATQFVLFVHPLV